ncbi:MAG TPA: hypothetical protein VF547_05730, partial [Allosphingosinicella sp.]
MLQGEPEPDGEVAALFAPAQGRLPAAEIGLILAGPALQLESGERRLDLRLTLSGLQWPESAEPSLFSGLAEAALQPSLLTDEGWHALGAADASLSTLSGDTAELVLRLLLPRTAPAAAAGAPALRLLLVQDAAVEGAPEGLTPLAVLAAARVEAVALSVAVEDLGDLAVSTSAGAAIAAPGLLAFGHAPSPGAYLQLDHPVLDRGRLDRVAVTLRWADPPPHPDGFTGWYRQYRVDLDRRLHDEGAPLLRNDSFAVRLSAPVGQGRKEGEYFLFSTGGGDGRVAPLSTFSLTAREGAEPGRRGASGVRMTLSAPEHGFGDLLYPVNVARATQLVASGAGGARRRGFWRWLLALLRKLLAAPLKPLAAMGKGLKKLWSLFSLTPDAFQPEPEPEALPPADTERADDLAALLPNPPWRAVLAAVRLDYTASFALDRQGSAGDIHLMHWSGWDAAVPVPWKDGARLLPDLPEQA